MTFFNHTVSPRKPCRLAEASTRRVGRRPVTLRRAGALTAPTRGASPEDPPPD